MRTTTPNAFWMMIRLLTIIPPTSVSMMMKTIIRTATGMMTMKMTNIMRIIISIRNNYFFITPNTLRIIVMSALTAFPSSFVIPMVHYDLHCCLHGDSDEYEYYRSNSYQPIEDNKDGPFHPYQHHDNVDHKFPLIPAWW